MSSNNECEKTLARLIATIIKYGTQIEDTRIALANNENFNPFHAFKRINSSGTGYITEDDLDDFLKYYGLYATQEELRQFFPFEKNTLTKMTYNHFLNQVLPVINIDLRNKCLERATKNTYGDDDMAFREVDRLITTIYQKEIEYSKVLEANKDRLATFNKTLLEAAFSALSDEITSYMSYKSVSELMKRHEYTFGKKEYEVFMRRIDKNYTSKVTPTDFKYLLFPLGTLTDPANRSINYQERSQHRSGQVFENISPIKSSIKGSPNKNNTSTEIKIPQARTPERSTYGERDLTPPKTRQGAISLDIRIPSGQDKRASSPFDARGKRLPTGKEASKTPERLSKTSSPGKRVAFDGTNSRGNLYNQEIAAINEQYAPEANFYQTNSQNPLEQRYLDPTYHSYWNYHREHNKTLSPDYFKKIITQTPNDYLQQSQQLLRTGTTATNYFNPSFVDPATHHNFERYPDNPFRHTDHGHYFQNYYAGLRNNYYETYYNHVPYQVKAPLNNTGRSLNQSRNSPMKFRAGDNEMPLRSFNYQANPQNYPDRPQPLMEKLSKYSPMRRREFVTNPEVDRPNSMSHADNGLYRYVAMPGSKPQPQAQSKLGRMQTVELEVPPPRTLLEDFMPRVDLQNTGYGNHADAKPYSFVVRGQN